LRFRETPLAPACLIEPDPVWDERGYFDRVFCARELRERGLDDRVAQCSVSYNARRGTLRGLHYQDRPAPEAKTVRCLRGAAYDVIVDLRPGSPTRHRWFAVELSARGGTAIHVPAGFAHGFITLEDDTALEYLISEFYVPQAARGIRFDDPALAIPWPIAPVVVSLRDRALPGLEEVAAV
jgi:dTDP-4-dehydrorhamnose 3,5-epimerase